MGLSGKEKQLDIEDLSDRVGHVLVGATDEQIGEIALRLAVVVVKQTPDPMGAARIFGAAVEARVGS